MSSGYDDRDNDREDEFDDRPRDRRDVIAVAKSRVRGPAIALLITGAGTILLAGIALINVFTLDKQLADVEAQWDNDPNLQPQQKKDMKQMLADAKPILKTSLPFAVALWSVTGLITVIGAVKMMSLSGSGLAKLGAILSMIPIFDYCCCLAGLPIGIWVLIALGKPEVKAGFAAKARGGADDYSSEFERR